MLRLGGLCLLLMATVAQGQCKPGAACCPRISVPANGAVQAPAVPAAPAAPSPPAVAETTEWFGCQFTPPPKSQLLDLPDRFCDHCGTCYEVVELECGCYLAVVIPGSDSCLLDRQRTFADLADALVELYRVAKLHEARK